MASALNQSPAAAEPSTSANDSPAPEDSPTPTPPLPTGPLPGLHATPSTLWKGLGWVAIPGGAAPAVPASNDESEGPNATIAGWSNGYVEFVWNPTARSLTSWVAADGIRWRSGKTLDTSSWKTEFAQYDAANVATADATPDPLYHNACSFHIDNFQEGPGSALLVGHVECGGGCGGPWATSALTWTSGDGFTWTIMNLKVFGAGGIGTISGGSNGFVALAAKGQAGLWTSGNGQDWVHGSLPAEALTAGSTIGDPASISGSFVLPTVLAVKRGHQTAGSGGGGCVRFGPTDQSLYQAAIWWSSDGQSWTRATLPSEPSYYGPVSLRVVRLDDRTLIADANYSTPDFSPITEVEWGSHDGRTWTRLASVVVQGYGPFYLTGRKRGLITTLGSDPGRASPNFATLDDAFKVVNLKETGSRPWVDNWQMALGPNGLLVTADGSRFWMAVPTS